MNSRKYSTENVVHPPPQGTIQTVIVEKDNNILYSALHFFISNPDPSISARDGYGQLI